ncbi:hypothetical protein LPC13_15565 [Clostridium celatum]|uniref:hypothetical protein n=1 Tax=Clostridium celatum TaxID=36834 RepID=UPI001F17AC65|nr:hypothetical protein [Clostridium celatum]MCE9656683.1 hypothetical protein [Clostridium celatum]
MLLIDYALLGLTGVVIYNGLNYLDNFKNIKWNKLQKGLKIENYKIIENEKNDFGYKLTIELPPGGTVSKLEDNIEAIEKAYKCRCLLSNIPFSNSVEVELVTKEIKGLKQPLIMLTPCQLLLGYDFKGNPIIADMEDTPHMGVVGTSKMGKSVAIEMALKMINDKVDITLLNTFTDKDFTSLDAIRINDLEAIKEYLEEQLNDKSWRERPLYILIDEYNVLSKSIKKIDDVIQGLLAQARHFNVLIICIMQLGNKEDCKFKNLFNCRLAFKTIEKQTISAFLGCPVQDTNIKRQEFYLYHTELIRGRTYDKG